MTPALDALLPGFLNRNTPGEKVVAGACLAACAIASSRRMVTLDRGFSNFRGLAVELRGRA